MCNIQHHVQWGFAWVAGITLAITAAASAQVVQIAPVIRLSPTPESEMHHPGPNPPESVESVPPDATFQLEIWATNANPPLEGLACVYADIDVDRPGFVDPDQPIDSPLLPINAVDPTIDAAAGHYDEIGGCQPAPPDEALGINEWVLVERIPMTPNPDAPANASGVPITIALSDANNLFADVTLLGQLSNVPPGDIDFQSATFCIGQCQDTIAPPVPTNTSLSAMVLAFIVAVASTWMRTSPPSVSQ